MVPQGLLQRFRWALVLAVVGCVRMPSTLELNLTSTAGKAPQHTPVWKGGESAWRAIVRFLSLLMLKTLTLMQCALDARPRKITVLGNNLLVIDIQVTVRLLQMALPCINVTGGHHMSLYKCRGSDEAQALANHVNGAIPLKAVGQVGGPVARHLSICRTARLVTGLDDTVENIREAIAKFYGMPFVELMSDQRKIHVSL